MTGQWILLPIIAIIPVSEAASVVLQILYFKATKGKRLFKMAPLHHHFELLGWSETQIVQRFWLIGLLGAILGIAVALDNGLMTVVTKDADQKPLRVIGQEVRQMAARARSGKVRPDDIEGSTFSISNLGMFDVDSFTAIINPPEAAILAVGSAREVPVVVDGEIKPGMRMKATLSVDHRVSDGAEGARFLQALELYLHEPLRLML